MTAERWWQVKSIFDGALACDASARAEFLSKECAGDDQLRCDVERLLAADQTAILGLEVPAGAGAIAHRYELTAKLGQGGMGVVYQARDRETEEVVALKFLRPELASDLAMEERLKKELRLARRVTHPNVARIYEFNRANGLAYISMEFVDGESLRDLLRRRGSLSPEEAVEIVRQLCTGLQAAHGQQVAHRDLKPENIMLDREARVKIMDFGIARSFADEETVTLGVSGTPQYMSPEQAHGLVSDHRTDIYSVGLILREMLSGVRPAPVSGRAGSNPAPLLEKIIAKCLEERPERRYQSAGELLAALNGERAPSRGVGIAAAVLLAAGTGAFLLMRGEPSQQAGRPASPVFAAAPQASLPSIAALPFTNSQQDPKYAQFEMALSDAFANALARSGRYRVVERTQLEKALDELRLNRTDAIDKSTAQRVGRLVGARYLLLGSFQVFEGEMRVNPRLIRVETGEVVSARSTTGRVQDALSLSDRAAEAFLGGLKD